MKDTTICDRCDNYEVSPGGCVETCHAQKEGSRVVIWLDDHYRDERFSGGKSHCKGFKKLYNRNLYT